MAKRLRHESEHAFQRARERRIEKDERQRVLRQPDRVELDGDFRLHFADNLRNTVSVVAVIVVGGGTAVLTKNPIFGISAGTFITIVTYYLRRKSKHA